MALTIQEKAEKLDRIEHKSKMAKLTAHVTMLRVTEFGTGLFTSIAMGALKAYQPTWETAMYGLVIDGTTAAVGGVLFFVAGEKKSGDYLREVGGGMIGAGLYSLGQKGGAKLYALLTAA